MLPAEWVADRDRMARFHREAQVLASLNHPHIAAIYGFEESTAAHALVMELVEGPTLAGRIRVAAPRAGQEVGEAERRPALRRPGIDEAAGHRHAKYRRASSALAIIRRVLSIWCSCQMPGVVHSCSATGVLR